MNQNTTHHVEVLGLALALDRVTGAASGDGHTLAGEVAGVVEESDMVWRACV